MWPALIGAAGSLFGGLFNSSSQSAMNRANNAAAARANAANLANSQAMNAANIAEARRAEAAGFGRDDNKIQRLVADAHLAGINPLAALGSPAAGSFASAIPAALGGAPDQVVPQIGGSSAFGDSIANAAAMLGESVSEGHELGLQQQRLQNKLLQAEVDQAQLRNATSRSLVSKARNESTNMKLASGHQVSAGDMTPYGDTASQYGMLVGEIQGLMKYLHDNMMSGPGARDLVGIPGGVKIETKDRDGNWVRRN